MPKPWLCPPSKKLHREQPAGLSAVELEHYKAQLAAWVEKQKEVSNINIEGFKSVILAGQNALRSSILLTGGAAVALRQWFYFGGSAWKEKVGFALNIVANLLGLGSYGLFAGGAWLAYHAFKGYA